MRARLIYAKRGGACFVPHIALAQMFTRSAARAGFRLIMTQGFSPRAKISFGPELPAGVVALNEPVDMYLADDTADIVPGMNASLPEGFTVSRVTFPPEDAPNLGRMCKSAEYLMRSTTGVNLAEHAADFWGGSVIDCENLEGWQRVIVSDPAQNPIGGLIRNLVSSGMISGWHEVNIVRVAVGLFDTDTRSVRL
ncbi:MAG: DUF2344 domain-containing protein [Synergistaceae bacterium]|nr:DUF2344 domain-containing protein [Synergistaceae bacterium]